MSEDGMPRGRHPGDSRRQLVKGLVGVGAVAGLMTVPLSARADPSEPHGTGEPWEQSSVTAYGATGDGSTDDQPAIQACLDANAGGLVYFPPGVYLIQARCLVSAGTVLYGYGATLLRGEECTTTMLTNVVGSAGTSYDNAGDIAWFGLTIDSNGAHVKENHDATAFVHCKNVTVRDCTFLRTRGFHALELQAVANAVVDHCVFKGFFIGGSESAWRAKECIQIDIAETDQTMCQDIKVTNCYAGPDDEGNPAPQVLVGSHSARAGLWHEGIVVQGCTGDEVGWSMVNGSTWRNCTITGNVTRNCRNWGLKVSNSSEMNTFVSNTIIGDADTTGIGLQHGGTGPCLHNVVTGNVVKAGALFDYQDGNTWGANDFQRLT